jgi:DNA-binding IclR family transcriptional regulator
MEKTLIKGLKMLEAVARSAEPRGVSDFAGELDITKSNAHRLLQTLVAARYVRHDPARGFYSVSPRLFELGMLVGARIDVRSVAAPVLRGIVERTGETAAVAVLDDREVVYVERIDSPNRLRIVVRTGERLPSYCSSSGKVLLAWAPEEVVDSLTGLTRYTKHTLTDLPSLKAELDRIRRRGYAVTRGEWHLEISSVAAPIRDRAGKVIAALAISGPTERFKANALKSYTEAALWGASEISAQIP